MMKENRLNTPSFQEYPKTFQGARFEVHTYYEGKRRKDVVIHPGASVILPVLDDTHLVLIRNERFVVGQTLWELPAGILEPGEEPIESAKRELIEETGYKAHQIERMTAFYTTPGICNEAMYAYIATELEWVGQSLDESEVITTEILTKQRVKEMILSGEILDGKSLATLLLYFFKEQQ